MKIFSAEQIRAWDIFTIEKEPVASLQLMERAAIACVDWLSENGFTQNPIAIFCAKGNNGGDGLAIARLLRERFISVRVFILEFGHKGTADFQANLERLHDKDCPIHFIQSEAHFPQLSPGEVLIDALYGSGLNRALDGLNAALAGWMNSSGHAIISIDIPSGMPTDSSSLHHPVVMARHTLSFQSYKLAFLFAANAPALGKLHILDIGLHPDYEAATIAAYDLTDLSLASAIYQPRHPFAHKGHFGHALLVAGSKGKMGAAVLAARACLRSGAGLATCLVPEQENGIVQTAVPEAMTMTGIEQASQLSVYQTAGIGPGLGTGEAVAPLLEYLVHTLPVPLVLDADALNVLAKQPALLKDIPPGSILTPHPKEFTRLFGESADEWERMKKAQEKAAELQVIIVLKGHFTFIAMPGGKGYFNNTGNAGMATAGSGDVLTGILTGLLAQGYPPEQAAILGVYLHGMAGDLAAKALSQEAMIAGDIIRFLGKAFKIIAARRQ
jgi:ADP-dependent NAD(P)H-hydrate dehydratase / NAD(P)H-hydrate epimerase